MAGPALAMNWEGHDDDWHKDMPVAQAFREAVDAKPLERRLPPCDRPLANVYEQIPISGKNCLPPRERSSPEQRK